MGVGSEQQKVVLRRFVAACNTDERIVAAFLGGSLAAGGADEWSDLDLYLITTDDAYDDFLQERRAFLQMFGDPVFLEDFDLPNTLFFVLDDGTEGELGCARESQFLDLNKGPYKVLLDRKGILAGVEFHGSQPTPSQQLENLRRQIYWFWHDLSHFLTAMARGQLWWAQGQLSVLRRCCLSLARFQEDITDADAVDDPYFKVEKVIPSIDTTLAQLRATFCPMERDAMLQSAIMLIAFYQDLAPVLATEYSLAYPTELEKLTLAHLDRLRRTIA